MRKLEHATDKTTTGVDAHDARYAQDLLTNELYNLIGDMADAPTIENHIKKGADYNKGTVLQGEVTPLMFAVQIGNVDAVKGLIKQKDLNLDAADSEGCSACHYAVIYNQPDILRLLAKAGANLDFKHSDKHLSPLELATFQNKDEFIPLFCELGIHITDLLLKLSVQNLFATKCRQIAAKYQNDYSIDHLTNEEVAVIMKAVNMKIESAFGLLHSLTILGKIEVDQYNRAKDDSLKPIPTDITSIFPEGFKPDMSQFDTEITDGYTIGRLSDYTIRGNKQNGSFKGEVIGNISDQFFKLQVVDGQVISEQRIDRNEAYALDAKRNPVIDTWQRQINEQKCDAYVMSID